MRSLRARLSRLWVRWIQSPLLLPVTAGLFALVFLASAVSVYNNARVVRNRLKDDFSRQQLRIVDQAADRIRWSLNVIQAEVAGLERHSRAAGRSELERTMRIAVERTRRLGVTQIGRLDASAPPFLVYEVGLPNPPENAAVHAPKDIGLLVEVTDTTGASETYLLLGAGERGAGKPGVRFYARVSVHALLAAMFGEIETGGGNMYLVERDGSLKSVPGAESAGTGPFAGARFLQDVNEPLASRLAAEPRGFVEAELAAPGERGNRLMFVSYATVSGEQFVDHPLGRLALVTSAEGLLADVDTIYRREFFTLGGLLLIMLLAGMLVAGYQQRTSRRLKLLVGEQDQIIASILTNSVDAIIVFDNENHIQMWNRGAQLIFGYTPEEMLGQTFRRLIPPDIDPDEEIARLDELVRQHGYVRNFITQRVTKDGRRITVDISRTPFRSEDGQFEGHTAVVKDVTEKHEFDQKMYNAEKLASIGLLASGVAHEISNPLAIILGFTDLLKERFEPDSDIYRDLEKIEANANQAQTIVNDLLGFSRSEHAVRKHADLAESVHRLAEFVRKTHLVKKTELEVEIDDNLPPVNGDSREIQQVLLNLVNNAAAAIDHKQGVVQIVANRAGDGWVQLCVKDNGRGIPEEIRPRVFDPFFTTKEFGEGTGLGLSLCYGLVRKWGGEIEFETRTAGEDRRNDSGTTFTIRIPVYDAEFNPEAAS